MHPLIAALIKFQPTYHQVVAFDHKKQKLVELDFTDNNKALTADIVDDVEKFQTYIKQQVRKADAHFGIGGYGENRTVYSRSRLFDGATPGEEPRRIHLGTDIWGPAGEPVFAPMGGMVHSFAFNNMPGDYGATLVLLHQLDGIPFYTLYGHISLADINVVQEGQYVSRGQRIAHFGSPAENGNWPPHLHFQVIADMELKSGDYPGVCRASEKEKYLQNCPDPDFILQMKRYT